MDDKILFLDIDGVMNSVSSSIFYEQILKKHEEYKKEMGIRSFLSTEFSNDAIANLWHIVEETNCKIVISSTWRHGETLDSMRAWFKGFPSIQNAIIGSTPKLVAVDVKTKKRSRNSVPRGMEIAAWLNDNGISTLDESRFVILDDESDMFCVDQALVHTDGYVGLTYRDALKVIDKFNSQSSWNILIAETE